MISKLFKKSDELSAINLEMVISKFQCTREPTAVHLAAHRLQLITISKNTLTTGDVLIHFGGQMLKQPYCFTYPHLFGMMFGSGQNNSNIYNVNPTNG